MKNAIRSILAIAIAAASVSAYAVDSQLTGGNYHTVFVDQGNVYAMGANGFRQTDPNSTVQLPLYYSATTQSVRVPTYTGIQNVRSVTASSSGANAAIKTDGSLVVWGWMANVNGNQITAKPYNPFPGTVVTDAAMSNYYLYYIVGGIVYQWDRVHAAVAVSTAQDGRAVSVAAGDNHAVVLFADGTVGTTGTTNTLGELGQPGVTSSPKVVKLYTFSNAVEVLASTGTTLVRTATGDIWGFGKNTSGQLGLGTTNNVLVPTMLPYVGAVKKMTLNYAAAVFQMADSTVKASGFHDFIGGTVYNSNTKFTTLPGLTAKEVISAGQSTFLKNGVGNQFCGWGGNGYGQLGNSINVEPHAPTCTTYVPVAPVAAPDPVATPVPMVLTAPAGTPAPVAAAPIAAPAPIVIPPKAVIAPIVIPPVVAPAPVVIRPLVVAPAPVVVAQATVVVTTCYTDNGKGNNGCNTGNDVVKKAAESPFVTMPAASASNGKH